MRAFLFTFLLSLFISATHAANSQCATSKINQYAVVSKIYDGDTVRLSSGEKIRLIGINTPEMNYDTGNPQPYAKKAKRFLVKELLNKKVGLRWGKEKIDRYGRKLAHVFNHKGANIQAILLAKGLARSIVIPPNTWQYKCYEAREMLAKKKNLGTWKSPLYRPINADRVNKTKTGFQYIKGSIKKITNVKGETHLHLSSKLNIRISKQDKPYFKTRNFNRYLGKNITVKGWLSRYKKNYSIRARHPSAIKIQ